LQSDGFFSVLKDAAGDALVCGPTETMLVRYPSQLLDDATFRRRRILRRRRAILSGHDAVVKITFTGSVVFVIP
jgi:hypothetical protein